MTDDTGRQADTGDVPPLSPRLARRIHADFAQSGRAQEVCDLVERASDSERIQTAIVLVSGGNLDALLDAISLAATDWRDVLMAGGLGHEGWEDRMNLALDSPRSLRWWHSRWKTRTSAPGTPLDPAWAMSANDVEVLENWLENDHGLDGLLQHPEQWTKEEAERAISMRQVETISLGALDPDDLSGRAQHIEAIDKINRALTLWEESQT